MNRIYKSPHSVNLGVCQLAKLNFCKLMLLLASNSTCPFGPILQRLACWKNHFKALQLPVQRFMNKNDHKYSLWTQAQLTSRIEYRYFGKSGKQGYNFFLHWKAPNSSLVHTSCRSQQLSQRARSLQVIGIFLFLLQWTATVAGRSRFAASLNEP